MSGNFEPDNVRKEIESLIRQVNSKSIIEEYKRKGKIDLLEYIEASNETINKSSKLMNVMSSAISSQQDLINALMYRLELQEKRLKKLRQVVSMIGFGFLILIGFVFFVD